MSLKEYRRKRDFTKTAEPAGDKPSRKSKSHRFVIQKHAATRLHYDFRLELGGTLVSWAVPKGLPYAKGEKHLAVKVEDHPLSYIGFEGTIPQGQYGGGTVMVWDAGTFEALSKSPLKDIENGKLHVVLNGKKVRGEWYLVRLREESQWLIIRAGANHAKISKKLDDSSAISGRTMAEIAGDDGNGEAGKVTKVKPAKTVAKPKAVKQTRGASKASANGSFPAFIEPMKARLVASAPPGDWLYEIKFDGFRAIAFKHNGEVRLLSRNNKDLARKFPEVVKAISELDAANFVLDGEVVALDPKGRSSFQLLQSFELGENRPPICFYAFDLLAEGRRNLLALPLTQRKERLKDLLTGASDVLRYSASLGSDVKPLVEKAKKMGLEGLIGKRKDSIYEAGRRSGAWIKLKLLLEQEFVIGGYTDPEGTRPYFGALLVGVHRHGKLVYSGKVGTGFTEAVLKNLHGKFKKLEKAACPFTNLPDKDSLTAAAMKKCHWLKPSLVCQVKFTEWTRDNRLRHPVYVGLREDKAAAEVVREVPA